MDVCPKFIIETDDEKGDCLIMSNCTYHKELVTNKEQVKGGGWFRIKDKTITFHGDSFDFGTAEIEDIKEAIENDNVYTNSLLTHSIAKNYKFIYDTQTELIPLN